MLATLQRLHKFKFHSLPQFLGTAGVCASSLENLKHKAKHQSVCVYER